MVKADVHPKIIFHASWVFLRESQASSCFASVPPNSCISLKMVNVFNMVFLYNKSFHSRSALPPRDRFAIAVWETFYAQYYSCHSVRHYRSSIVREPRRHFTQPPQRKGEKREVWWKDFAESFHEPFESSLSGMPPLLLHTIRKHKAHMRIAVHLLRIQYTRQSHLFFIIRRPHTNRKYKPCVYQLASVLFSVCGALFSLCPMSLITNNQFTRPAQIIQFQFNEHVCITIPS